MRPALSLILLLLAACPAAQEATPSGSKAHFSTQEDVRLGLGSVELPYLIAFSGTPDPHQATSCPSVSKAGNVYTLGGGCTDARGVRYEGEVEITMQPSATGVDYQFVYRGFSTTQASGTLSVDGTMSAALKASDCGFPGPAPLTTDDLRVVISGDQIEGFGGFFPGNGKTVSLRYSGYEYAWDLHCEPSTITAHGNIVLDGLGAFAVASSRQATKACKRESASGQVTLTGANTAALTHAGATNCDNCLDYQISDGSPGQLCW